MPANRQRSRLLIIALGLLAVTGLTSSLLGTAWPTMQAEFDRPIQDLGVLAAIGIAAGSLSAAISGTLGRRFGLSRLLTAGPVLSVAGLLFFAVSETWAAVIGASVVLSLGWGLMDPAVNAHVALEHGPRTMNLLHASFGVGAIGGPLLMARSIAEFENWRPAYLIGAAVMLVAAGGVVWKRSAWRTSAPKDRGLPPALLSTVPYMSAFMLAVAIELSVGQWSFSILEERGFALEPTARFVASFWGGLTVGRLFGVVVGGMASYRLTLAASISVLAAGVVWFAADPSGWGAWGLPFAGAGMALVFPTMVSVSAAGFGEDTDYVIGWSFAAAGIGGGLGPWLVGVAGARFGLDIIGWLLVGVVAFLAVVALAAASQSAKSVPVEVN